MTMPLGEIPASAATGVLLRSRIRTDLLSEARPVHHGITTTNHWDRRRPPPATITYRSACRAARSTAATAQLRSGKRHEAPVHGAWGELDACGVGGLHAAVRQWHPEGLPAKWENICFYNDRPVPVRNGTGGKAEDCIGRIRTPLSILDVEPACDARGAPCYKGYPRTPATTHPAASETNEQAVSAPVYGNFSPDGREYVITGRIAEAVGERDLSPRVRDDREPGRVGLLVMTPRTLNRHHAAGQDWSRDSWGKYVYCCDRAAGRTGPGLHGQARPDAYECGTAWATPRITPAHHGIERSTDLRPAPAITRDLGASRLPLSKPVAHPRPLHLPRVEPGTRARHPRGSTSSSIETEYAARALRCWPTSGLTTIAEHGPGSPGNPTGARSPFQARRACGGWEKATMPGFIGPARSRAPGPAGTALTKSAGKWQDGIGCPGEVTLAPREGARKWVFTLGIADTPPAGVPSRASTRRPRRFEPRGGGSGKHWTALAVAAPRFRPRTRPRRAHQRLAQVPAISCRIPGRTGYYQAGPAPGASATSSRIAGLPAARRGARRAAVQLHGRPPVRGGTTDHWWHPLTEEASQAPNDDLLWLPFVTLNYCARAADFALLEKPIAFLGPRADPAGAGTLYEHCRRAIRQLLEPALPRAACPHGAGRLDDGFPHRAPPPSESVWLAHFLVASSMAG